MKKYEVQFTDHCLPNTFFAHQMTIENRGTLCFWSETRRIMAFNNNCWRSARLLKEKEEEKS